VVTTNPGTGYTNASQYYGNGDWQREIGSKSPNTDDNKGIASFSGRVLDRLWLVPVADSAAVVNTATLRVFHRELRSPNITDSTLHGIIQQLVAANDSPCIFGDSSINVFSNVQVTASGQTIFTNTNVSASVGTKSLRHYSVLPFNIVYEQLRGLRFGGIYDYQAV
jgi:hypothetical protein